MPKKKKKKKRSFKGNSFYDCCVTEYIVQWNPAGNAHTSFKMMHVISLEKLKKSTCYGFVLFQSIGHTLFYVIPVN